MHSDNDERPLRVAHVFSIVLHRHSSVGEVLVVSSESEVLPERLDPFREFVHAHAHRRSRLHVLLPARKNPKRLPLLHPHHDHDDHHHYHRCDDYHDGCDHDIDVGWFWCFPAGEDYDYDGGASCLWSGAVSCCGCEGVRDFPGASAAGGCVPCFGEFEGILAGDACGRAAEVRWRRCV